MGRSRNKSSTFLDDEENIFYELSIVEPDLAEFLYCHSPQATEEWYPEDRLSLALHHKGTPILSTGNDYSEQWNIIYNNLYYETAKYQDKTIWEHHQQIIIEACTKGLKKYEILKLIPLDYEKWATNARIYFKKNNINNVYDALKIITIDNVKLVQKSKLIIEQYIKEINITLIRKSK